jgi:hypothetical protein
MNPAWNFVSLSCLDKSVLFLSVTFNWEMAFVLATATTTTTTTTATAKLDSL